MSEREDAMGRAYAALREKWESEKPDRPPDIRRYVFTVECDPETAESIKAFIRGYPMRYRTCREVRIGGLR